MLGRIIHHLAMTKVLEGYKLTEEGVAFLSETWHGSCSFGGRTAEITVDLYARAGAITGAVPTARVTFTGDAAYWNDENGEVPRTWAGDAYVSFDRDTSTGVVLDSGRRYEKMVLHIDNDGQALCGTCVFYTKSDSGRFHFHTIHLRRSTPFILLKLTSPR